MNLVDKLLQIDAKKFTERATKEIEIKRLSEMMGEPFIVTIGEIDGERFAELSAMSMDKKGRFDYSKSYNTSALIVTEGVISPDLKDAALQKHFGAASPKDLAVKLFKGDISRIMSEITDLSGFNSEDEAEEDEIVKN